uniref:Acid phosphatase 1-like n=1 Tax=Nicotiana tabacum TaxID=4097 RepID=A0A1S4CDT1_TOBAC|nr:PREDICTED: acid phosphatase 1-like [Nicotiana tabacum]
MKETNAPAVKHGLKLYDEIKAKGYKAFLISSRRECLRDATVDNLIKVGYHGWSYLILRGLEDEHRGVQNYKAEARKQLVNEGYRIYIRWAKEEVKERVQWLF